MDLENFKELGLSDSLLKDLQKKGFEEPTEIQRKIIPAMLTENIDLVGQAQTGTGKTAAFGLPIIEKLEKNRKDVQAIILVPTRELALQVAEELNSFRGKKKAQIIPVYGGQSIMDQSRKIAKGVEIIVGTPGRILDHMRRGTLQLKTVSYVVLDEADEMLNMGFIDEVDEILKQTNPDRRTLLFSATMPESIMKIAKKHMKEYRVIASKGITLTTDLTDQIYFEVHENDKFEALCRIIDMERSFYGLIFCRTKVAVDELSNRLTDRGYLAEGIHGDLSQSQREKMLDKFRKHRTSILVATDVAARGIDVINLSHVINYSLPQDPEAYVHRIGRTGRAGKKGIAITFISPSEYRKLMFIAKIAKANIRKEKIPGASDIIKMRKSRMNTDITELIAEGSHVEYLKTAESMLKNNSPEEIIAALIKYSFEDELDENRYREINETSVDSRGTTRLFISLGRKDGIDIRKLIKLINNQTGVRPGQISDIKVMESFSFITVPFEEAEVILSIFNSSGDSGVMVQKANDRKDDTRETRKPYSYKGQERKDSAKKDSGRGDKKRSASVQHSAPGARSAGKPKAGRKKEQ
ncbi:MAG TPA: DEAD/DEAH box helicase [Spirochaetota bacterium]|nr:DEAD/DEAH box helicase [Spirochaetota bacterium]